jgi:subfamily B ATP-binding cassette protein MsbA
MGIGKFTLPLVFPLAFKYIIDALLTAHASLSGIDRVIDRFCTATAHTAGFAATPETKLGALSASLLALYIVQALASYYRNYWGGIAGLRLIYDLQCALFSHLQKLPNSFFDRNPVGGIVSRVLNDVMLANEFVSSALIDVWMDAISLLLVVIVLFMLDWRLALVALCIMPSWVIFMRYFSPRIKAVSHRMQQVAEQLSGEVHERVAGAVTVKAFAGEEREIANFEIRNQQLRARGIDKIQLAAKQEMLIQLLTRSAPVIVIWVAAIIIMHGSMTLGTLVAFFTYLGFLYLPLERFAQLSVVLSTALAAIERIFNFLDLKPAIVDHPLSRPFAVRNGSVQFENLSFSYRATQDENSQPVLQNINLHIEGGSKIALVGHSGAGKTTLASLIPRFYDATGGRVLIDGKDVKHFTLKALRQNISLVTQDTILFSASVRDNLLYAREDADEAMLWKALEMANIEGFIKSLPEGLDTIIGERGVKVSGGQRQRLALARAFLKDSRIVILDEATSAIDSESENLIHEAMERLMDGRTVLLIAHRLRSAINADLIVAMENGTIAETGRHGDLLARGGTYARIFNEQMRGLDFVNGEAERTA